MFVLGSSDGDLEIDCKTKDRFYRRKIDQRQYRARILQLKVKINIDLNYFKQGAYIQIEYFSIK